MSCIKYVCFTLKHQLIVVVIGSNVIWCPSYLYLSSSPSQPFFLQMSPCTKKYHREGVVSVVLAIGWTHSKVKTIKSTRTIAIHTHTPECEKPLEINYGLTYTCIECDERIFIYWKRVMVSRHGSTTTQYTLHYAKRTSARARMSLCALSVYVCIHSLQAI